MKHQNAHVSVHELELKAGGNLSGGDDELLRYSPGRGCLHQGVVFWSLGTLKTLEAKFVAAGKQHTMFKVQKFKVLFVLFF